MKFHFYAPKAFEPWDHRSPDGPGIGGSETAVVELAARLALRGHDVDVYADIPDDCPPVGRGGDRWHRPGEADFEAPGVWCLSRCPDALDHFGPVHPGRLTLLICQDVYYPPLLEDGLTPERSSRLDLCLPLCEDQERWLLEKSPELAGKMRRSTNGIKADAIEVLGPVERDPYRIIFTSSPDRGLPNLLKIFRRAREFEPRLNLRAAYGFDNIRKCKGRHWVRIREECEAGMEQPGCTWLGRLGQRELHREFLGAGLWVYPTNFTETSCITCMESQALGAVPVTNPLWALKDNVRHGVFIHGNPDDPLVRARYVGEVLRLAGDHGLQESIRAESMPWARGRFDWERVADQYEGIARALDE